MDEKFSDEKYYEEYDQVREPVERILTGSKPINNLETRWYFDYFDLYWEIKARLMGGWITQNKDDEYVIVKPENSFPLMNSTGVEQTMAFINIFITKIQALSIIDEERIFVFNRYLHKKLAKLYYIKMEDFGLTPDKASLVIIAIVNMFEMNMRKSIGGKSLNLLGSTEHYRDRPQPERKKLLGLF